MARHSFSKKVIYTSLLATQLFAIIPATNVLAKQTNNKSITSNKSINSNQKTNDNQWMTFGFEDEEELKSKIIQSETFIGDWAELADCLGFAWCGGTNSEYVGRDFGFKRTTENGKPVYILKGNYNKNDKYATGYRANETLEMKISNVRFVIDPTTIKFGKSKITEEKPVIVSSAYATNNDNKEDSVEMGFKYSSEITTSKTDNVSFTEGVGIKTTFVTGIPHLFEGKLETNFDFSANHGWSNTNQESQSTSTATKYTAQVPAKSKRLVELVSIQKKSEVPYSAKIYMEYDITFTGFLKWSGNAHIDHPDHRPTVSIKFGGKDNMSATEQLLDMYKHRNINGYSEWDWNYLIKGLGKNNVDSLIDKICKKNYGGILTGVFTGIDGTHVNVKAHKSKPVKEKRSNKNKRRNRRSVNSSIKIEDFTTNDKGNVKVNSLIVNNGNEIYTISPKK